jgi:hypothetical protein
MKKTLLFGALVFALSGCASTGGGEAAKSGDAAAATAAIEAAEAVIKKSAAIDGGWRDADHVFLKKAKEAAGKGDFAEAAKQAKKAQFEGEMGLQQAMDQASAKPWLF